MKKKTDLMTPDELANWKWKRFKLEMALIRAAKRWHKILTKTEWTSEEKAEANLVDCISRLNQFEKEGNRG